MSDQTIQIKYVGTAQRWPEISITGRQSVWMPGQIESRSPSEASALLATGLFSSPPVPVTAVTGPGGGLKSPPQESARRSQNSPLRKAPRRSPLPRPLSPRNSSPATTTSRSEAPAPAANRLQTTGQTRTATEASRLRSTSRGIGGTRSY